MNYSLKNRMIHYYSINDLMNSITSQSEEFKNSISEDSFDRVLTTRRPQFVQESITSVLKSLHTLNNEPIAGMVFTELN